MDAIDKIVSLMSEKGISAAQLSREAGLTSGLITQWKQRKQKPSMNNITKIAAYFDVSVDDLLNIEKPTAPKGEQLASGEVLEMAKEIMELSPENRERMADYLSLLKTRDTS